MVSPRVASSGTQRAVNWLAAQWRIHAKKNKKKSDSENHDDVQNCEDIAYKQFCDDTSVEKTNAIDEANGKITVLKAEIEKAEIEKAKVKALEEKLEQHEREIKEIVNEFGSFVKQEFGSFVKHFGKLTDKVVCLAGSIVSEEVVVEHLAKSVATFRIAINEDRNEANRVFDHRFCGVQNELDDFRDQLEEMRLACNPTKKTKRKGG